MHRTTRTRLAPGGEQPAGSVRLSRRKLASHYTAFLRSLRNHRPETRGTYARALREFLRWFAGDRAFRFRSADVARYRRHLIRTRRLSPVSVATYLSALRRLCAYLVSSGVLTSNPAREVTAYRRPRKHAHAALSRRGVRRLLVGVRGHDEMALRDALLLRLMLYSGLTESEIVRANIGDIDRTGTSLAVQGKGRRGKDAVVQLPPPVRDALGRYLKSRGNAAAGSPLVLTAGNSSRGSRMTTRAVRDRINRYLLQAGLRRGTGSNGVTAYSLRLTAALLLKAEGASTDEIRKRLRLGTLTTARIYMNARPTAGAGGS